MTCPIIHQKLEEFTNVDKHTVQLFENSWPMKPKRDNSEMNNSGGKTPSSAGGANSLLVTYGRRAGWSSATRNLAEHSLQLEARPRELVLLSQHLAQETDAATNPRVPDRATKRVHRRSNHTEQEEQMRHQHHQRLLVFAPNFAFPSDLAATSVGADFLFASTSGFATAGGRGTKATKSGRGAFPRTPPFPFTAPLPLAAPGPNIREDTIELKQDGVVRLQKPRHGDGSTQPRAPQEDSLQVSLIETNENHTYYVSSLRTCCLAVISAFIALMKTCRHYLHVQPCSATTAPQTWIHTISGRAALSLRVGPFCCGTTKRRQTS